MDEFDKWVLYKEFGKYKLTRELNYNSMISNADIVITLHCDNIADVYEIIKQHGFKKEQIVNRTGDDYYVSNH